jgi:hypothetical protein
MGIGPNSPFWAVFFWIDVVLCVTLGIWIVHRLEKERKQLKDAFKDHYLRQFKWLFRHELKEHGIDAGGATHSESKKRP